VLSTLDNLRTTSATITSQKAGLDNLFTSGADTASVLRSFLAANEQNMITLVDTSKQTYALLQEYSPEFTCLFGGLANLHQLASSIFVNHQIQLRVTLNSDKFSNTGYTPGQQPRYISGYGPNCFGLPDNPQPVDANGNFQIPGKYRCINDGAPLTEDPCAAGSNKTASASTSALGSPSENQLVNTLIASSMHTSPDKVPGVATMLAAPLLRGTAVTVK
jgi:hypothetical protein